MEGLASRWLGDGRPLLAAAAGGLMFAGGFAIFLAMTGDFLPHDVHYLGMTASDLCEVDCRIVNFMVHDRSAFGGALFGLGVLYLWLVSFPLADRQAWAWWTLVLTGILGFGTFLAYLGYGYLDTWHGIGTLILLPVFGAGIVRSRALVAGSSFRALLVPGAVLEISRPAVGRVVLLLGAAGTFAAGIIILALGTTDVFVPEDLEFIGLSASELRAISPKLVSLIAHDRAGFGGAAATVGLTTLLSLFCAHRREASSKPSAWQASCP